MAASPISTAIRIIQLNGKRTRLKSVGAIAEMVMAHIELMIDENRNPTPMISAAFCHGVCSVTPLNAKPTVNAAAALIAVMRAQNLREQIIASALVLARRCHHWDFEHPGHLHRRRSKPAAGREATGQRLIQLDRNLL